MIFRSLDEMNVYHDSLKAADAVSALLERAAFRKDFELVDQLGQASAGVPANISEGYGQGTDAHFAHFLGIARGSCNETRTYLAIARGRRYVSELELKEFSRRYDRIGRQLTNLIKHLRKENRRRRGNPRSSAQ